MVWQTTHRQGCGYEDSRREDYDGEKAAPDGRVQPSAHDHSEKVKAVEIAAETTVQG